MRQKFTQTIDLWYFQNHQEKNNTTFLSLCFFFYFVTTIFFFYLLCLSFFSPLYLLCILSLRYLPFFLSSYYSFFAVHLIFHPHPHFLIISFYHFAFRFFSIPLHATFFSIPLFFIYLSSIRTDFKFFYFAFSS